MTSRRMSKSRSSRVSTKPSEDYVALVLTVRTDLQPPNATSGRGPVASRGLPPTNLQAEDLPSRTHRLEESNERRNTRGEGACTISFHRLRRPGGPIGQPRSGVGHPPTAPFRPRMVDGF